MSVLAVVAWCVFIFVMSAQPADESTELSMGVVWHIIGFIVPGYDQMSPADQLYWQQALDHPVRKTAHFLEYAVLGALMLNAVVRVMGNQGDGEDAGQEGAGQPAVNQPEASQMAVDKAEAGQPAVSQAGASQAQTSQENACPEDAAREAAGRVSARHLPAIFSKPTFIAWIFATAVAAFDEVHQVFVPGRAGMVSDVFLDAAGALVGVLLATLVSRLFSRKSTHRAR